MSERGSIRIIVGNLNRGGTETQISLIFPKLVELGWQVKILTISSNPGQLAAQIAKEGISVYSPKLANNKLTKLLNALYLIACDLIKDRKSITCMFLPQAYLIGMLASFIAMSCSKKIMFRRSLNHYQQKYKLLRITELLCHYFVNKIVGNTQIIAKQLISDEGVNPKKVEVIYNGQTIREIPIDAEKANLKKELGIPENSTIFITVANLIKYKGHEEIIAALAMIKDKLPTDWSILFVGKDNGIQKNLSTQAQDLGIANNIKFLGSRNDVWELLQSSDIYICASHEEGLSNSVIEATLAELPVIATDVGGNSEIIKHEETGIIVKPHCPKEIAEAILQLFSDRNSAINMGKKARISSISKFSLERAVNDYDSFLKQFTNKV
jgi:glycosyltransferase involved in cell wall biosynthesis